MTDTEREAGTWLQIGGNNSAGHGQGYIEIRKSTGGRGWKWERATPEELKLILDAVNSRARTEAEGVDDVAYQDLTERLQALCGEFGCCAGEHRLDWLHERLTRLRKLESPTPPAGEAVVEVKTADNLGYAFLDGTMDLAAAYRSVSTSSYPPLKRPPAGEAVERVARALCRERVLENLSLDGRSKSRSKSDDFIRRAVDNGFDAFMESARIALAAMSSPDEREPTVEPGHK